MSATSCVPIERRGRFGIWAWLTIAGLVPAWPMGAMAASHPKVVVSRPSSETGRILYVTAQRAYFSKGKDEGLHLGLSLLLKRSERPIGRCRVDQLAKHQGSCRWNGAKPALGDVFDLPPHSPVHKAPEPARHPLVSPAQLATQRTALKSASFLPVEYRPSADERQARSLRTDIDFTQATWGESPNLADDQAQRVDLQVRGADLGGGFQAFIDLTALHWSQLRSDTRFPNTAANQLFVRELQISWRGANQPFGFSVGRVLPWHTPGVGPFDGIQTGWRSSSGTEAGLIAGTVPNAVTTAPDFQHRLAGAYFTATVNDSVGPIRWLQGSAALTADGISGLGWHYALDAQGFVSFRRNLDMDGEIRLGMGGPQETSFIEVVRLDVNAKPTESSALSGRVRYVFDSLDEVVDPGLSSVVEHAVHVDAAYHQTLSSVSLGVTSGFIRDMQSNLNRYFGGPELRLPAFFGTLGSLALGYQEYGGWRTGRDLYVQAFLLPMSRFRLMGQLSYFLAGVTGSPFDTTPEAAGTVSAEWTVMRGFSLHASVLSHFLLGMPSPSDLSIPWELATTVGAQARF